MNIDSLDKAIREAQRFLKLAHETKAIAKADEMIFYGSKRTAATKRASLDLTRALADMRRPS
jgi:hypothetical protein